MSGIGKWATQHLEESPNAMFRIFHDVMETFFVRSQAILGLPAE
jgi:hypothetical protein